jgi:23S rRNA pseudouridine1911/1915/1917 synthase
VLNYVTIHISEEGEKAGRDIRWFLRARLGLSRTKIRSLKFDPRGILLDGTPVPNWTRVRAGQVLQVLLTDSENREKHILANALPLDILFEDENLLILNKPAGLVCHPAKGHLIDTLSNGVQYYFESQGDLDSRIHLVGRLDKEVSGIVTIAKNAVVSERLQADREAGRLEKHYTALVRGVITEDSFELRTEMREAVNEDDFRRAVPAEEAQRSKALGAEDGASPLSYSAPKRCVTHCRVLTRSDAFTLLDVCPDTGRLHQIRFSLAEAGFPILGDTLYGHDPDDPKIGRVMLHARFLRFTDPFSGEVREITADLPESFSALF